LTPSTKTTWTGATEHEIRLLDTVDNVWIDNDDGPHQYDDFEVARLAAQTVDVMLRQRPGRCRAKEYVPGPLKLRDEVPTVMNAETALRKMEEGLI